MSFLRWLAGFYLYKFATMFVFLLCGFAAVFLSEYIVDYFRLDDDAGMYVKLGLFVAVLLPILWTYDKYREWRFFNDE